MKKNKPLYSIKYKIADEPYAHLVNATYQKLQSAMDKVEELKQLCGIAEIVVWRKWNMQTVKMYQWNDGFELVYIRTE